MLPTSPSITRKKRCATFLRLTVYLNCLKPEARIQKDCNTAPEHGTNILSTEAFNLCQVGKVGNMEVQLTKAYTGWVAILSFPNIYMLRRNIQLHCSLPGFLIICKSITVRTQGSWLCASLSSCFFSVSEYMRTLPFPSQLRVHNGKNSRRQP